MQLRITMNEMMKAAPALLKAIPNMHEVALARRSWSFVQRPTEVLEVGQVGLVKPQLADVLQGFDHLLNVPMGQEGDRVPVPLVVDDVGVEPDQIVRHQ